MAVIAPAPLFIDGKEFQVFTETQLSGLNREKLKQRALNLRDAVGQDNLPPMPRQPEQVVAWILTVQSILSGAAPVAPPSSAGRGRPVSGGYAPSNRGDDYDIPDNVSEAQVAYLEAKKGSQASRMRNQGGGMAGIFGGN
eukprot:TRINITY_DN64248_c0_g1_i1.p2 TRINITY_DN64248_c0_g1~~TRINITY_DN64248_c0_g1_i1.p2  ORF type:complete len:161 (+),score=46.52 TRINITY_DN64248_c0_g1_i1:66-485(+)